MKIETKAATRSVVSLKLRFLILSSAQMASSRKDPNTILMMAPNMNRCSKKASILAITRFYRHLTLETPFLSRVIETMMLVMVTMRKIMDCRLSMALSDL